MKLRLFLAALVIAAMSGCAQKGGWQEKHIEFEGKSYVGYFIESEEVIQNDTLNGKALLTAGVSSKNDTTYSIYLPSKSSQFSFDKTSVVDDYVVINGIKYWYLMPIHTHDAEPLLGFPCGYDIGLDRSVPNLMAMPQIEVSYYHNETPIKMTFKAK